MLDRPITCQLLQVRHTVPQCRCLPAGPSAWRCSSLVARPLATCYQRRLCTCAVSKAWPWPPWALRLLPVSGADHSLQNTVLRAPGAPSTTVLEAASCTGSVLQQPCCNTLYVTPSLAFAASEGMAGIVVAGMQLQQEGLGGGDLRPVRGVCAGSNQGRLAGKQASGAAAVLHARRHWTLDHGNQRGSCQRHQCSQLIISSIWCIAVTTRCMLGPGACRFLRYNR